MQLRNALLASLISVCAAQDADPLTAFTQALNANGLTSFARLLPTLNSSTIGQGLFRTLTSGGNFSLFIPNNEAISQVPANVAGDADALARIVSYHVLPGSFRDSSGNLTAETLPNVTVGRTLLNDSSLVDLEGRRNQVLVWGSSEGRVRILNQTPNTTVVNSTALGGFGIFAIDHVLRVPGSFSEALALGNEATPSLSSDTILGLLNSTQSANNVSFTSLLDGSDAKGYTFFVPNNAAIQAAQSTLASLQGNLTAVQIVLGNHIINGSTLYSTTLANSTSAAGQPLTFNTNSSGTFVSSGNVASAQIVHTNVLTKNGVVHIIDRVLANTESNSQAASSAFNEATSTAAQTSTATGPVANPTGTGTGNGGNGNGGGNGGNGAFSVHSQLSSVFLLVGITTIATLI